VIGIFSLWLVNGRGEIRTISMGRSSIEVILFDLGNVILPFNHYQIAERLSLYAQEREFRDPQRIFSYLFDLKEGKINDFDIGRVSPPEFFQSLKRHLDLSISLEQFIPIWNDIFVEDQEVSRIIRSLKERWRLGLLSNTDPLHFEYILTKFPIVTAFDKWILSFEVGFQKPAIEIFHKAIEWASVEPQRILFIDDVRKHVEVANSLGMQCIHFLSAQQFMEELDVKLTAP
jgi:putative hydrolase of the HAD superfamily